MSVFELADIEFPVTVAVRRPAGSFDGNGDFMESYIVVAEALAADIQLSLRVRSHVSEDNTGREEDGVWTMYCAAAADILAGDMIEEGGRCYTVDAVGNWGSHLECLLSADPQS